MTNMWLRGNRRSSVQIAAAVLRISDTKDTTKSELIDYVKISHKQIQKYLKWLVELQLLYMVNTENNHCLYRSTQKGQNLVSIVDEVQQLLVK